MGVRVGVDLAYCQASGLCHAMYPELFGTRADGYPVVLDDRPGSEADVEHARDAAECCPGGAIVVEDGDETEGGRRR